MLNAPSPLASLLTAITMPQWGATMEEGTIVAWRVREGDYVEAGAEIAEVETSKLCNAVEAPTSGTILRLVCEPWRQMRVGRLLAVVGPAGADPCDIDAWIDEHDAWAEADEPTREMKSGVLEVGTQLIAYSEAGAGDPPLVPADAARSASTFRGMGRRARTQVGATSRSWRRMSAQRSTSSGSAGPYLSGTTWAPPSLCNWPVADQTRSRASWRSRAWGSGAAWRGNSSAACGGPIAAAIGRPWRG
jgi:pyruvate dehydrogenase E2 component (dihydrolipoamide acetyltransferase)